MGGHEENYQDSLVNAANRVRERVGTFSAARTTRVRIERDKGIPPRRHRRQHSSSVRNHSNKEFAHRADESEGVPQEQAPLPACYNDSTAIRAREALALSFVDKDLAPRAIPERIHAQKLCTGTCKHPQVSSLAFGKIFPAADIASKSRRPRSRGRPQNQGGRAFREPFWPEPVVAQGQGRVNCRGRMPREHSNPRCHPQGREDQGRVCPLSRCTPSSPVLRFPCIRPYVTRGNKEGSCFLEKPPEQEDKKSSPSSLMELKFELDTRLTVSCVVLLHRRTAY